MKCICQDIQTLMEAFETLEVCILLWVASGSIDGVAGGTITFHYNSDKKRKFVMGRQCESCKLRHIAEILYYFIELGEGD